jgi:hypothetical protein
MKFPLNLGIKKPLQQYNTGEVSLVSTYHK